MRKSWLMCVLLGTLAWGQALPGAPTPPQAAQAPVDTSAAVPSDAAVITVMGVCPAQPKTAAAKGTAAKPVTAAKAPAAKTPAADCKTVITKAQFEKLIGNLTPNVTPQTKKQLANLLPRLIAMSTEAKQKGMDKTPQFKDRAKFREMQILAETLQQSIQDEAAKVPPEEIEKYYKEHAETFEQFNVDRLYVPRTKQGEAEAIDEEEKDEKPTEEAKKAKAAEEKAKADEGEQSMTKLAESLRGRAAAGEDFVKLQKEAFDAAGMKIESPNVNLANLRRTGLAQGHAAVFDMKPGEISQVISDAGGHYIYKMNSKTQLPLEQATNEIRGKLQNERTREMMEKVNNSFKVETNDQYFGPGGLGVAPSPRQPNPRPMPPGPQMTQPGPGGVGTAPPPPAKPN
jgi:hypothetical protein